MVEPAIQIEVNKSDKPTGIIFRSRDQISEDMILSVFEKVIQ